MDVEIPHALLFHAKLVVRKYTVIVAATVLGGDLIQRSCSRDAAKAAPVRVNAVRVVDRATEAGVTGRYAA